MSYFSRFILSGSGFIFSLIAFIAGFYFISDYKEGPSISEIRKYETMIGDSTRVSAKYRAPSDPYKILPISNKDSYTMRYDFIVDNIKYSGKITVDKVPTDSTVDIYYLKSNPSINCINPKELIKSEKNKGSTEHLILGIVFLAGGLLGLFDTIYSFIKMITSGDRAQE